MNRGEIVIIIALLSGTISVHGQFVETVGVKAGISVANQSHQFTTIDYTLDTDPVMGPFVAVFLESYRREHLSFQLDLAYVSKGSKTTTQSITINHLDNDRIIVNEGDLQVSKFNYLSFSPLVRARIEKERITPYVVFGPRVDFLLKYESDSDYPLEEQNRFILGLTGGVGVEFKFNKLGVFTEIQFQSDIHPVTGKAPLLINNHLLLFTLGDRYLNNL